MATLVDSIGIANNLDEPQPVLNRKEAIIGIVISFMIVAWICALGRFYVRFRVIKSPWWDDLFVLLSSISGTIGAVGVGTMTEHGMGQHVVLLSAAEFREYLRSFWVANATYPCSTAFIKLALLLQFLRVYDRGTKIFHTTVALVVVTGLWGLAYGILAWFPTSPVDAYWNLTKPAARYGYGTEYVDVFIATYESHAAINMLLDALVLVVAVPIFFRPGIRKNSFWGLIGLFSIGGIVNMLSIWRLQSIVETRATTLPTFDPTWYGATPVVLSTMEVGLATACASLPVFWPALKKQLGPYIMVTHEVKITREERRWDDEIELRRPTPLPGMFAEAVHVEEARMAHGKRESGRSEEEEDDGLGGERRGGPPRYQPGGAFASKDGIVTTSSPMPLSLGRLTPVRSFSEDMKL